MRVVPIASLEARLAMIGPDALLRELTTSDVMLAHRTPSTRTAFVSYRQERGCGDPALTLDGEAMASALNAAKRGEFDALWLDAWCYRFSGTYDHQDFCTTLSEVLSNVQAVVWLRRSKAGASGTYGYRLWCTFEAVCVEQLNLPVLIAGHELSRRQRALATFGSFATSTGCLGGDGVTDQLCLVNFVYYAAQALMMSANAAGATFAMISLQVAVTGAAFNTLLFLLAWTTFRHQGSLGQQRRLAQNAGRVMHVMFRADSADPEARDAPALLRDLPWLPAHDRRDVMVLQQLLVRMSSDHEGDDFQAAGHVLAFSAYAAAACSPTPGDGDPRAQSVGQWLLERGIAMDGRSSRVVDSGAIAQSFTLPMLELQRFGWRRLRGADSCCALVLPTGFLLAMRPPQRSVRGEIWRVNTGVIEVLPQYGTHRIWVPLAVADILLSLVLILWAILIGTGVVVQWEEVKSHLADGLLAFWWALTAVAYVWTVTRDEPRLRCGRAPFPILCFTTLWLNWLGAIFCAAFFSKGVVTVALCVHCSANAWAGLGFTASCLFDMGGFIWYTAQYHRHYLPPSKAAVVGDLGFSLSAATLAANVSGQPLLLEDAMQEGQLSSVRSETSPHRIVDDGVVDSADSPRSRKTSRDSNVEADVPARRDPSLELESLLVAEDDHEGEESATVTAADEATRPSSPSLAV